MQQVETKHRKYQVFKWIDALERGYPHEENYPPTISNLALHMIEADVRKPALVRLHGRGALRKPYNKRMVNYMKRYLNNLLARYQRGLFNERQEPKTERTSYGIQEGIESKRYSGGDVTVYYLSPRGRHELEDLHEMALRHHEMAPTTYRKDSVDKIIVPKLEGRNSWWTKEIVLMRNTGIKT